MRRNNLKRIYNEKANAVRYFYFFAFVFLIILWKGEELKAQTDFSHVTDLPVLDSGTDGEYDFGGVWFPAVIHDNDTLKMWFTGFDRSAWGGNPVGKIGYAWSLDGIVWNKFKENPVLTSDLSWETGMVMTCAVIKDGDTFKMWYGAKSYAPGVIGYATSPDGKIWTKHADPVLETEHGDWDRAVIAPHTVIKKDSVYKMWYWAGTGWRGKVIVQYGLAISSDGINWKKYDDPSTTQAPFAFSDPVMEPGAPGEWDDGKLLSPMVLSTETGYEMWYNSSSKVSGDPYYIGYATSPDGIVWSKSAENPVLNTFPSWGEWYGGGTVLKIKEEYHFWYSLFHTEQKGQPKIGYSSSPENLTDVGAK